jgi:hypothetical protein
MADACRSDDRQTTPNNLKMFNIKAEDEQCDKKQNHSIVRVRHQERRRRNTTGNAARDRTSARDGLRTVDAPFTPYGPPTTKHQALRQMTPRGYDPDQ